MQRTEPHKKYACARLFLFLQREIDEHRPLTAGEREWYETELKVRPTDPDPTGRDKGTGK